METNHNIKYQALFFLLKLIFYFGILTTGLNAQDSNLYHLQVKTSKTNISIGEKFLFLLSIDYPTNIQIERSLNLKIEPFEIKDYSFMPPITNKDRIQQTIQYTISIYQTGTFQLTSPTFQARQTQKDGSKTKINIVAPPIAIQVTPLSSSNDKEIYDNANLIDATGKLSVINISAFILLMLALIGFILYLNYYHKKSKEKKSPPFEIALQEITTLLEKKYFEKEVYKQFYYQFSRIIRHYLERTSPIRATTMTSSQICKALSHHKVSDAKFYEKTCLYADKVKFSTFKPGKKETLKLLNQFHDILYVAKERQKILKSK